MTINLPRAPSWLEARSNIAVERTMFTKDILFGMNILSLAGFAVMGLSLTLRRIPLITEIQQLIFSER